MSARKTTKDARTATLEKLVRRFMGLVNHLPPAVMSVALMEAEVKGADKMERGELVSQGYKRIALLMQEAYRETGEEDE